MEGSKFCGKEPVSSQEAAPPPEAGLLLQRQATCAPYSLQQAPPSSSPCLLVTGHYQVSRALPVLSIIKLKLRERYPKVPGYSECSPLYLPFQAPSCPIIQATMVPKKLGEQRAQQQTHPWTRIRA